MFNYAMHTYVGPLLILIIGLLQIYIEYTVCNYNAYTYVYACA